MKMKFLWPHCFVFLISGCLSLTSLAATSLTAKQQKNTRCDIKLKENKTELCAQIDFIIAPNRKKSSDFKLTIFNPASPKDHLEKKQKFEVITWLWMEMPNQEGHGSDAIELTKKSNNSYMAQNVWFLMEGDWQLHVQLRHNGKVRAQGKKVYCVSGRRHTCSQSSEANQTNQSH